MNHYADGTICLRGTTKSDGSPDILAGVLTDETGTAQHLILVDHKEDTDPDWGDGTQGGTWGAILIFPELRDIDGTYILGENFDACGLLTSADTTNGLDGTWVLQSSVVGTATRSPLSVEVIPDYREGIYAWSATGKRAVQFWFANSSGLDSNFLREFHVYGEIGSGETPDRLLFIDDQTGLEYGVTQDWGNRPRGAAADKDIRVKNNSGTLTANSITIGRGRTETAPSDASTWYTMDNGSGFGSSVSITSLTAGSEDTWTLRQIIPTTAVPGLYETWISYDATSWT
jgi:hypothetical protein